METIKTTQGEILTAMGAIIRLRQKVKGHDALNVFHLKNALQEYVDFQAEEEQKLITKYGGAVRENGVVYIPDKDKRQQFSDEYKKLLDLDVEMKTGMISLSLENCPDVTLEDIEQLNKFIIFK